VTTAPATVTGTAQWAAWQWRVLPPVEEVRPGVWSMPVPIPDSPLRYTLSYAFVGDHGVVIVDPGWDSAEGRAALTVGLASAGAVLRDVAGVVVTHVHIDHHGLSGWLQEVAGAWVAMHPLEARTLPARLWKTTTVPDDRVWLRESGVPVDELEGLLIDPSRMADLLRMTEPDRLLADGDRVPIPGRDVRAVWTPGHTPGHLCLRDAEAGVLLTGDHLLPRISPNIGIRRGIEGDPLRDYLGSLAKIRDGADAELEALPAHEYRFRDVPGRAAQLIAHHDDRSAELLAAVSRLRSPTAWAIAAELTWSRGWDALHGFLRRMALAETIAHLYYLRGRGDLISSGTDPIRWSAPGAGGAGSR
jgi:glyoxylase-like metal-dependent hydrolase (beta-lactamase superfamily II)